MKFQLPSLKLIGQLLFVLIIAALTGLGLLTLVYTIPNDKIINNVADSTYIFDYEGDYPRLSEYYVSELDNFTDAIMLKESAYQGNESAFQKALLAPRNLITDSSIESPVKELVQYYAHPEKNHTVGTYARYWHGYLLFIKPLLSFLNYGQIRSLNFTIQLIISSLILVLLIIKKNWQLIPAYVLTILMLRIEMSAYNMQSSNIYYVIMTASILLLLLNEKLLIKNRYLFFFLLLGAITSYIDFLTYPLVAFGIPVALFVFMNRNNKYSDIRIVLNALVCWGIGYVGMWASKWILATIFTSENVIADAISMIRFRSGSRSGEIVYTYKDTLRETFMNFISTPYLMFYIIMLLLEIISFIFLHKNNPARETLSFVFISLLPLLWYVGTINHSYQHRTILTYKEWSITTFALLALFANIEIKKKKH